MGIPLLAGREFTQNDREKGAAPVAIINDTHGGAATWPNQDPLGKRLQLPGQKGIPSNRWHRQDRRLPNRLAKAPQSCV